MQELGNVWYFDLFIIGFVIGLLIIGFVLLSWARLKKRYSFKKNVKRDIREVSTGARQIQYAVKKDTVDGSDALKNFKNTKNNR